MVRRRRDGDRGRERRDRATKEKVPMHEGRARRSAGKTGRVTTGPPVFGRENLKKIGFREASPRQIDGHARVRRTDDRRVADRIRPLASNEPNAEKATRRGDKGDLGEWAVSPDLEISARAIDDLKAGPKIAEIAGGRRSDLRGKSATADKLLVAEENFRGTVRRNPVEKRRGRGDLRKIDRIDLNEAHPERNFAARARECEALSLQGESAISAPITERSNEPTASTSWNSRRRRLAEGRDQRRISDPRSQDRP